ncbi:prepilin-type N-terminal cleavage/methylation domain-containing protein [Candidatus Omnitrophota bacterium]
MRNRYSRKTRKIMNCSKKGFTLAEVVVAIGIFVLVIAALLKIFVDCSVLTELSRNMIFALNEAQGQVEEIRNWPYDLIATDFISGGAPGNTFPPAPVDWAGAIYLYDATDPANPVLITVPTSPTPDLLQIEVVVCWRNKSGRVSGEDENTNGILDIAQGEDVNGNNKIDSLATVVTMLSRR